MTIPPFPSQDLAKLVLGYLAEEQLMTAYDEFLQASPYLDVLRNEYDRIFMTSLKSILAEYRAVKIYVETCKPVSLRRRLFQCSNLLEIVKFLIHHIDVNKISAQDTSVIKSSSSELDIQNVTHCEVCASLKLASCACKSRQTNTHSKTVSIDTSATECAVETTSLTDLPGNQSTYNSKHMKMTEKETNLPQNNSSNESKHPHVLNSVNAEQSFNSSNGSQMKFNNDTSIPHSLNLSVKTADILEASQKIEEFNDILNIVCNNSVIAGSRCNSSSSGNVDSQRLSTADTFQDFAIGVSDGDGAKASVPETNTSKNLSIQVPVNKENSIPDMSQYNKMVKYPGKTQCLLKIGNNLGTQSAKDLNNMSSVDRNNLKPINILPKPDEQKITILSDIRMENKFNSNNKCGKPHGNKPSASKNATSAPVVQMQTIFINGTPAFNAKPPIAQNCNFTKDEIMAMPTIILVPGSGPSHVPSICQNQIIPPQMETVSSKHISSTPLSLEPISIDLDSPNSQRNNENLKNALEENIKKAPNENNLIKTVESTKNATVPKDNTIACSNKTNTPRVLPPKRKSSSTPRRTSHVRVLNFTTPRRIFHETINEHESNQNCNSDVEVIISGSPNLTVSDTANIANYDHNTAIDEIEASSNVDNESTKENNINIPVINKNKNNWDADLRALVVTNQIDDNPGPSSKPRAKQKIWKSKKSTQNQPEKECFNKGKKERRQRDMRKKSSPKRTGTKKKKRKSDEVASEHPVTVAEEKVDIPIKPTINIISGPTPTHDATKVENKTNIEEEIDTPEMDRLCLQNAIGMKLNISDLLETPYKQALYDIQMETPRFLSPNFPDEPVSDIKITNIPTPRFLNDPTSGFTPKPEQATPSSYSSRPTDYSSGGSYYKPDDHDYMPIPEDLQSSITSLTKEKKIEPESSNTSNTTSKDKISGFKSTRPVRQCTKNVSYFNKTKEVDDKVEVVSSCSDTRSLNSSNETITGKEPHLKSSNGNKSRVQIKSETKKKINTSNRRQSTAKKDTPKTFIKITPRRPTPTKDRDAKKNKRSTCKSPQHTSVKSQKKRMTSRENTPTTPFVALVPTKSRRKSSTPRKLHCNKTFSESSGHNSPETLFKPKEDIVGNINVPPAAVLNFEKLPFQTDDPKENQINLSVNETDDISKIQEYIETSKSKDVRSEKESSLHIDLIKRGFDVETAKIIERDLLDPPPQSEHSTLQTKNDNLVLEKTIESEYSITNDLHTQENEENDEIELSEYECNEDSVNFLTYEYDATKEKLDNQLPKLKDKFSMEVCIDDGVAIRIRATPFSILLDQDPSEVDLIDYSYQEINQAVSSISNMDKLYTPLKDPIRAQCFEIFDSTLTSLDTPVKSNSPKRKEYATTVTEIVLEVEQIVEKAEIKDKAGVKLKEQDTERRDVKHRSEEQISEKDLKDKTESKISGEEAEQTEPKKRKRSHSGNSSDEVLNGTKRARPEAQYLLNSANIQNIDIESVLSKLHGP